MNFDGPSFWIGMALGVLLVRPLLREVFLAVYVDHKLWSTIHRHIFTHRRSW